MTFSHSASGCLGSIDWLASGTSTNALAHHGSHRGINPLTLIYTETMSSSLSFFINDGSTVLITHESMSMVRWMKVWWRMLVPQMEQRKRPKRQSNSLSVEERYRRRRRNHSQGGGDLFRYGIIVQKSLGLVWIGLDCHMHLCVMCF